MISKYRASFATLCLSGLCFLLPFKGDGAIRNPRPTVTKEIPAGTSDKIDFITPLSKMPKKATESKLGLRLRRALGKKERSGRAAALQTLKAAKSVSKDNSEYVLAVVRPATSSDRACLINELTAQGASILRTGKTFLKIKIPLEKLESASELSQVGHIRALAPPREKAATGEGVGATSADSWHNYGFTGRGVKVAVVDSGYMHLSSLISAGELPADYIPVNFSSDADLDDTSAHGSACAEIIYDMAPDAELHLIKIDDVLDLTDVRDYCIAQGIDIVSCSLGWDVMNFHDGVAYDNWATSAEEHPVTIVNQMNDAGILCVFAAGNEQERQSFINWGSSGDELLLNDTGSNLNLLFDADGDTTFAAGSYISVFMTWNRWPLTDKDFDIYLYRNTGSEWNKVASSQEIQNGTEGSYPVEILEYTTTQTGEFGVLVQRYKNTDTPWILLRCYGDVIYPNYWRYNDQYTPAPGSISIPADASAAFSVGAINYSSYPGGPIDYYSSLGPNNRGYTGGTAVIKPDICAPAGVSSQSYNSEFNGTSAATPHVAGLAALVKGEYPYYTVDQLKDYIEENSFDIAPSGKDNSNGSGAAQLPTSLTVIESEALKTTALAQDSGSAILQLTGLPGEQYTVQARDSLTSGSWQSIGTVTIGDDGRATFTDTGASASSRFYKIVK